MNKIIKFFLVLILTWITISMNACSPPSHNPGSSSAFNPSMDDVLLSKSKEILTKNCTSCHRVGGPGGAALNLASSADFIRSGLVVPGRPNQSKLIFRLKNFVNTSSTENNNNMPPNGEAISNADFQTLYSWILEMPSEKSPYECKEQAIDYTALPISDAKRLSVRQYRNTIVDLLGPAITRNVAQAVLNTATSGLFFPEDTGSYFKRENNVFDGNHGQAFFSTADNLANALSSNTSHTQALITYFVNLSPGACTSTNISSLSATCRSRFVQNFGSRVLRRPLRTADLNLRSQTNSIIDEAEPLIAEFGLSGPVNEGLNRLLFRLLISPHFLTQIEDQNLVGRQYLSSNVYILNSFAIINRLSYRFWNTMPDEALWNMAISEDLSADDGYLKALNYVLGNSTKLDDSLKEYMNDWLKLDNIPQFAPNPKFSLLSPVTFDSQLRQDMINEVLELGSYVARNKGSFKDLFTNDVSFARSNSLMNLYGMSVPAPSNVSPTNAVRFPAGQRAGFLTRGAMLISGSELANPIVRGYHIRKDILCLTLDTPPSDALDIFNSINVPHTSTTREKVHIKTSGASCIQCHNVINPLGFALSNYNSFGSFITREPIFSNSGNSIETTVPIDSQVNLSGVLGINGNINGALEYSKVLAEQQSAKACFSEKIMRYTFNRGVSSTKDACRLDKIYNNLHDSGYLLDTYRSSAMDFEFRARRIESSGSN